MPLTTCAFWCDFDVLDGVNVTECELLKTVNSEFNSLVESVADGSGLANVIREPMASLLCLKKGLSLVL